MDQDTLKAQKKTLMNLYALFAVTIILGVVPHMAAAALSTLFFILLLILCYALRARTDENSLIENHTTYLIRTLWMAGFIALIMLIAASIYVVGAIDHMPILPCYDAMMGQSEAAIRALDTAALQRIFTPCIGPFIEINAKPLLIGGVIAIVPVVIYVAWRFFAGLSRAIKGYRLADPKAWF